MDRTEYERIATKYIDMVYRIAFNHIGKEQDADDIVQQTFYKLLTYRGEFKDEEHMKRWLIRVCINECNSLFSGFWRKRLQILPRIWTKTNNSDIIVPDLCPECTVKRRIPDRNGVAV